MAIIRTEDLGAFKTIHVQNPSSEQDGGSLVALGKPLSAGHAISKNCSSFNGILEAINGGECLTDTFQIVGLLEPLVILSNSSIELDRNPERRRFQCSRR
jgi:hypothetical protein